MKKAKTFGALGMLLTLCFGLSQVSGAEAARPSNSDRDSAQPISQRDVDTNQCEPNYEGQIKICTNCQSDYNFCIAQCAFQGPPSPNCTSLCYADYRACIFGSC